MKEEFPELDDRQHQKEFLSDWWSPRKLFQTSIRGDGKSTLICCELRRFRRSGMKCLVLTPTMNSNKHLDYLYQSLFGEKITSDRSSIQGLKMGNSRGIKYDVILIDEIQELEEDLFVNELLISEPLFIRATSTRFERTNNGILKNADQFFDSIYTR